MKLIKCNVCGNLISDMAETCPSCGIKTKYGKEKQEAKTLLISMIVGFIVILIGAIILLPALITLVSEYDDWYFWNWYKEFSNETVQKVGIGIGLIAGGLIYIHILSKFVIENNIITLPEKDKINTVLRCRKCNTILNPNDKFCGGCGTKIERNGESTVEKSDEKLCTSCGKKIIEGKKYCYYCGTRLVVPEFDMNQNIQTQHQICDESLEDISKKIYKKGGNIALAVGMISFIILMIIKLVGQPIEVTTSFGSGYMGGLSNDTMEMINLFLGISVVDIVIGVILYFKGDKKQ